MYNILMAKNAAVPFTTFHLTRHRMGGVAGIDQTTKLRWEGETGTVTCCWRGGERSWPADAARVAALWDRLEALGFWEWRPPWRGLMGWLFDSAPVMDAMETSISATAVVDGRRRRAGFSLSSPCHHADEAALAMLKVIDQFFAGADLTA
jgi:hypothetical protein